MYLMDDFTLCYVLSLPEHIDRQCTALHWSQCSHGGHFWRFLSLDAQASSMSLPLYRKGRGGREGTADSWYNTQVAFLRDRVVLRQVRFSFLFCEECSIHRLTWELVATTEDCNGYVIFFGNKVSQIRSLLKGKGQRCADREPYVTFFLPSVCWAEASFQIGNWCLQHPLLFFFLFFSFLVPMSPPL